MALPRQSSGEVYLNVDHTERSRSAKQQSWIDSFIQSDNGTSIKQQTRLHRVPNLLLKTNDHQNFRPTVVSIGPYHHGNVDFKQAEELKPAIAKEFLSDKDKSIDAVFSTFEEEIIRIKVREYYEPTNMDQGDDEFVQMMFLDGCFLLHFLTCHGSKKPVHPQIAHYHTYMQQDLLLMENQLPFVVLDIIMSQVFDQKRRKGMLQEIHNFIMENTGALKRLGKAHPIEKSSDLGSTSNNSAEPPLHLLEILRTEIVGRDVDKPESCEGDEVIGYSLRGVKELMDVGITFQPSDTSSLRNVRFESQSIGAKLRLPPFHIDDSTGRKLLNIIAYELCPEGPLDPEVTSYVCFFDFLVDKAEDVKELRAAGIIHNFIANDEEVAKLFSDMATNLVPNLDTYAGVQKQLKRHCNNKGKIWMAQVVSTHFRSPWTVFALFWAIATLIANILETGVSFT